MSKSATEFNKRFNSMEQKAKNYLASWQDLAKYLNPTRGWFSDGKRIRGQMIDHKVILDAHATNSIRKSASALNSGITSKSRPWFKLTVAEESIAEMPSVRLWLEGVQKQMYSILEGSNIYGSFQNTYEELLTFGTGCFIILEDFESVIRTRSFTVGEYSLGIDKKGKVDSFARKFEMTASQLVGSFGYDKCPPQVQANWDNNRVDETYEVRNLIEPNDTADARFADFKNMPYRSVYWISGSSTDILDTRGFKRFNVVAPRWSVPTTDIIYGFGPGWDALGDVKELQKTKYDKLLAQEKLHNPPMQEDGSVEGNSNFLPGGKTKTSGTVPNAGVRPAYQINPNLESFIEAINQTKQAIDKHFFTDIFTMLASLDRGQMTAREVAAREGERIMLMGPILNQLDEEMLSPVISILFDIMYDNNMIPPPPQELEGQEIKIQYVSVLAQMQRSLGGTAIDNIVGYVAQVAPVNPSIIDTINWDESVRQKANAEGASEKVLNDPSVINSIRQQRAQAESAQNALASGDTAAKIGKTLSETELDKNSSLDKMRELVGSQR